jgi:hypothetical protein
LVIFDMILAFLLRLAWNMILLLMLLAQLEWQAHTTMPSFFPLRWGLANFLALNCDLPDQFLPSKYLGLQAYATTLSFNLLFQIGSCTVSQADLRLGFSYLHLLSSWDYRCAPLYLATKFQILIMSNIPFFLCLLILLG